MAHEHSGIRRAWGLAVVLAAAAITAGVSASPQDGPQTPVMPTFRASVDLIAVDVQVVDHNGLPITNLSPNQFDVTIDGHRRQVVSMNLVQYDEANLPVTTQALTGPAASNDLLTTPGHGRTFVLAIDAASFNMGESRGVAQAARGFVNQLAPDDRVGLYTFPIGPRMDPLTDRSEIRRQLDTVMGDKQETSNRFHLTPTEIIDINAESSTMAAQMSSGGTQSQGGFPGYSGFSALVGNETPTLRAVQLRECGSDFSSRCVDDIQTEAKALAYELEGLVTRSLTGLRDLVQGLGELPGRKTVVVFSAGMPVSDRPGGRPNVADEAREIGEAAATSNATIYALHIDSGTDMFSAERRRGAIHGDTRPASQFATSRILDEFSSLSGGTLMRVLVGLGEGALNRVLRETSAYYLLGVAPGNADRDGRTHKLKVKVDDHDVTVRSRTYVIVPPKRT